MLPQTFLTSSRRMAEDYARQHFGGEGVVLEVGCTQGAIQWYNSDFNVDSYGLHDDFFVMESIPPWCIKFAGRVSRD